jgi:hypothetical protein
MLAYSQLRMRPRIKEYTMTKPSLGEKLQKIYDLADEARVGHHGGITLQELEDQKAVVVERLARLKASIYDDLNEDRIPSIRIEDRKDQEWFDLAQKGKAPFQKLYTEFQEELGEDGIKVSFAEQHDGGGMKSWLAAHVRPIEKKVYRSPAHG